MAGETTAIVRTAIVSLGMIGVLAQPALAKHAKTGEAVPDPQISITPEGGQIVTAELLAANTLESAIDLCQLVADDKRAIMDALDFGGWTSEVDYNVGNAPFYKELSADQTYEGVGKVEIWGFIEEYPGYKIGYCSFTIDEPDVVFDLSPLQEIDGLDGELQVEGQQSYGAWRSVTEPGETATTFIHAYQNIDTFLYQITVIQNLEN